MQRNVYAFHSEEKGYPYGHMYLFIMTKKNTLLYLNRELVRLAKRENINISRLTEEALRRKLNLKTPRSPEVFLQGLLKEAENVQESWFYARTCALPLQVESLSLNEIEPFHNLELIFQKDAVNIIYGPKESGKSLVLHMILLAFGRQHSQLQIPLEKGIISVKLFKDQNSITISPSSYTYNHRGEFMKEYSCLLSDDPFSEYDFPKDQITSFLNLLEELPMQIIVTSSRPVENLIHKTDIHLISLTNAIKIARA